MFFKYCLSNNSPRSHGWWRLDLPDPRVHGHTHPCITCREQVGLGISKASPSPDLCDSECTQVCFPESLPSLSCLGGEGGLWVSHFPAYLRPWGGNPARPLWSAQQLSRQVPRVSETVGEFWRDRSPDKSSLQSRSRRADCDPGRVTAQLQP